jgi:hypothetical protein
MRPSLHDLPPLQHNDFVAVADGAKAMSHDKARTSSPPEIVHDGFL